MALVRLLPFVAAILLLVPAPAAQCELAKLRDADTDLFGRSVAIHGDIAWMGGFIKALAYRFEAGEWHQTADFESALAGSFGEAIATDGQTAAVGSTPSGSVPLGLVYIYERNGDTWTLVATLSGIGSTNDDDFGDSVAVSGSTILVGAPNDPALGELAGRVHVFERMSGVWTETAQLSPAVVPPLLRFGQSVALQGERALIGAIGPAGGVTGAGSAFVFERQAGVWVETAQLVGQQPKADDNAGHAVALDGDLAVVGVPGRDAHGDDAGAVFVFEHGPGGWAQTAELLAFDGAAHELFGTSVSTSEDRILVGKPHDSGAPSEDVQTAYLFARAGSGWDVTAIHPSDEGADIFYGGAVGLWDDMALIGAQNDGDSTPEPLGSGGSVYAYDIDAITTWTDLGQGLASAGGVPSLVIEGDLFAGHTLTATLSGAAPGAMTGVIFGLGIAGVPFKGGTLVPQPQFAILATTNPAGEIVAMPTLHHTLLPGLTLVVQAWIADAGGPVGFAASNAISGVVQ